MIDRAWSIVGVISLTIVVFSLVLREAHCQPSQSKAAKTDTSGRDANRPPQHEAFVQVEEDAALPRLLVIGDSISMGYTLPPRAALKHKANVQHCPESARSSRQIADRLDKYLGDKPWDEILINCGIHDITYLNPAGRAAEPDQGGSIQVPLKEYRANLEKIATRLKQTGAVVVWCTTTPVSKTAQFRSASDVDQYNDTAREVMQRHGVQIVDLHRIIEY